MPRRHKEVETLLTELKQSMQSCNLWANTPPPKSAFNSRVPFAYDVMAFEQWLQFVFIPKMHSIIEAKQAMPEELALLPMAQMQLSDQQIYQPVKQVIAKIDLVFSGN